MDEYGPQSYGESFADVYDEWYADVSDIDATVAGIAGLARGGTVLELGVGTGRLALPLATAGMTVIGVDASRSMLDQLRAKPGAEAITIIEGDMASPAVDDATIDVAFAAFNTFFNLTEATSHQRCVAALHRAVRPGGAVAIEAFVPPDGGLTDGGVSVRQITTTRAVLSASTHDAGAQLIRGQHIDITAEGIRMRPWMLRYLTPPQLDDLFAAGGFALEQRTADWTGTPFDDAAELHVSVYRRRDDRPDASTAAPSADAAT